MTIFFLISVGTGSRGNLLHGVGAIEVNTRLRAFEMRMQSLTLHTAVQDYIF